MAISCLSKSGAGLEPRQDIPARLRPMRQGLAAILCRWFADDADLVPMTEPKSGPALTKRRAEMLQSPRTKRHLVLA